MGCAASASAPDVESVDADVESVDGSIDADVESVVGRIDPDVESVDAEAAKTPPSKPTRAKLSPSNAPTDPKPRSTSEFARPPSMATLIPPESALKKLQSHLKEAQQQHQLHSDKLRESLRELVRAVVAAAPTSQVESAPSSPLLDPSFLALAGDGLEGQPLGTTVGLALINELRGLYGFAPDAFSASWAAQAKQHCQYYIATGETGHYEDPKSKYYTKGGDEAAHNSGVAYGGRQFVDALNSLLAGPFHRRSLINPWPSNIGPCHLRGGGEDERVCALLPGKPINKETMWEDHANLSPRFKCYPPDGFKKAFGTFGGETPDPRPPDARSACGLIVSVVFGKPEDIRNFRKLSVHRFHDATAHQEVAHWSKDPARGGTPVSEAEWLMIYNQPKPKGKNHLETQEEVWLGALNPLPAGHRFEVDLTFEFEGGATVRLTWSFETLPPTAWTVDDPEGGDYSTALLFSRACDTLHFARRGGVYKVVPGMRGTSLEFARVQGADGAQLLLDHLLIHRPLEICGCHVSLETPIQLYHGFGDQTPFELMFKQCSFGRCEKILMFHGTTSFRGCDFTECEAVEQGRFFVYMGPDADGVRVEQCRFGPSSRLEVWGAVTSPLHRMNGLVTPSDDGDAERRRRAAAGFQAS
jgi:hypothetical protein